MVVFNNANYFEFLFIQTCYRFIQNIRGIFIAKKPGRSFIDDSTFSINRKNFGINYAGASDNLIRDDVVLTLKVRGAK